MNEVLNKLNELEVQGKFKRTKVSTVPQMRLILKCLVKYYPDKLRSQEISDEISLEKKKVDARLKKLIELKLVKASGVGMKYIKDALNDGYIFPGGISEIVDRFIRNVLKQAISRNSIRNILIHILNGYTTEINTKDLSNIISIINLKKFDNIDLILNKLKLLIGENDLLNFYNIVFKAIDDNKLYEEVNGYGKLTRQCRAYKYHIL